MGPHAPHDDAAFRRPGSAASPQETRAEPWTWGLGPDEGTPTPMTATRPAAVSAPREQHVVRASWDPNPEPIVPDSVGGDGPDWARILTRSLALVAAGVCAGILLSRPWSPRDDPPPTPAETSVGAPAGSPEPTRR
ncbi:hypothetical protein [Tessaracoccus sp. G1721]